MGVDRLLIPAPYVFAVLPGTSGPHAYSPTCSTPRRYVAIIALPAVARFSEQPMVLEVRKDLPANTVPEFVALLKANGVKMQYGSAGAGTTTHLACSRSEEHTSELQSHLNLVCRLLLEKKKISTLSHLLG